MIDLRNFSIEQLQCWRAIDSLVHRVEYLESNTVDRREYEKVLEHMKEVDKSIAFANWFLGAVDLKIEEILERLDKVDNDIREIDSVKLEIESLGKKVVKAKVRLFKDLKEVSEKVNKNNEQLEDLVVRMNKLNLN